MWYRYQWPVPKWCRSISGLDQTWHPAGPNLGLSSLRPLSAYCQWIGRPTEHLHCQMQAETARAWQHWPPRSSEDSLSIHLRPKTGPRLPIKGKTPMRNLSTSTRTRRWYLRPESKVWQLCRFRSRVRRKPRSVRLPPSWIRSNGQLGQWQSH